MAIRRNDSVHCTVPLRSQTSMAPVLVSFSLVQATALPSAVHLPAIHAAGFRSKSTLQTKLAGGYE